MSLLGIIVTYTCSWWILLLAVLPFGVRRSENVLPGQEIGAPDQPHLRLKFLITTILAGLVVVIFHYLGQFLEIERLIES
jgi:predicted secreted protein